MSRKRFGLLSVATLLASLVAWSAWFLASTDGSPPELTVPSAAGLNYGMPHTVAGRWVGTEWLRSRSAGGFWEETFPALGADLDFIQQHSLGKVIRLFIGLDQAMLWDDSQGYIGFDETTLQHLSQVLDMLDARGMRAVAVIFDQEQVAGLGNFHFEALDGKHPAMRQNYLKGLATFLQRFGARQTVIGWDLFNEAYNSLGRDGHLPAPPHADPVSPNFSDQTVHAWLIELYRTARAAAPSALFTVSDSTELYWNPTPDLAKYRDVVDFYDIHVYDDNPTYPDWRSSLDKPYIVGEAGASTTDQHYDDQAKNSAAVTYLLQHAKSAGVSAVLVQGRAFTPSRDALTPTGAVLAGFLSREPGPGAGRPHADPRDRVKAVVVSTARRLWRLINS